MRDYEYLRIVILICFLFFTMDSQGQSRKDLLELISKGEVHAQHAEAFADTIPVNIIDGWIVLEVKIGQTKKKLIWDTGTAYSTINSVDKEFTELDNSNFSFTDIVGKNVKSRLYRLSRMSVGALDFDGLTFMLLDLKNSGSEALSKFDGLIGLNVIDKVNWKFNFDNGYVILSKKPFEVLKERTIRYANYVQYNTFLTKIALPNGKKHTVQVLIDFGVTNSSFFLSGSNLKAFKDCDAEISESSGIGVGGLGTVDTIYRIDKPFPCTLGPKGQDLAEQIKIVIGSRSVRNVVGSSFFTNYNFVRNSDNSTFTLYNRENSVKEGSGSLKKYGINLYFNNQQELRVIGVDRSEDQELHKLKSGDIVMSLNNRKASEFKNDKELQSYIQELSTHNGQLIVILKNGTEAHLSALSPAYYKIQ